MTINEFLLFDVLIEDRSSHRAQLTSNPQVVAAQRKPLLPPGDKRTEMFPAADFLRSL
jgi:hypothetical protein